MGKARAIGPRGLTPWAVLVWILAIIAFPACAQQSVAEAEPQTYAERGAATCLKCHDKAANTAILHTAHAMSGDPRTPFAQHACESCHGASSKHVQTRVPEGQKRPPPAVIFNGAAASPPEERIAVCLNCHRGAARLHWQGSQHPVAGIACNDCHQSHQVADPVLGKTTQAKVCATCHTEQWAQAQQYSHHPIREGKVACSDCHNPHGSAADKLLKEVRVNDTCYACHPDKRGPLLWEHQPVREDCTLCHAPHGAIGQRLLKERMPYLCDGCHADTGGGMGGLPYGHQSLVGGSAPPATVRLQLRSCLNCHSQIHGSNSPSGGTFFR